MATVDELYRALTNGLSPDVAIRVANLIATDGTGFIGGQGAVDAVVAGTGITVDDSVPSRPVVSSSGGSSAVYFLDLLHNSSADNYFGWSSIPLKTNGEQTVTVVSPLLTIAATSGIAEPELIAPAFLSGDLVVNRFELSVWNAAGTQKKSWRRTDIGSLVASSDQFIDLSTGTVFDSVGSDITWDSGWGGPFSTAGGQFQFAATLLLVMTDLA